MVMCKLNLLGLYTVLSLITIYGVDVCGAECEEYIIVFEETICPKSYKLTPLKSNKINWDTVNYPCNSTNKDLGKKCLIEFNYTSIDRNCKKHIVGTNFQNHTFVADSHSAKLIVTTEAGLVAATTENNTATSIVTTTEALDVPKSNITGEKPQHTVQEYNPTTYDVNIIYINDNTIRNSLEKINEPDKRNKTLQCEYAEIVCADDGKPESYNLSHHDKLPEILEIEINRDEASAVQPPFTGYFPESSNDSSTNYNDNFSDQTVITLTSCSIKKVSNCKQNIESLKHINVYLKTNYVENNTITMYPNCTKESNTTEDKLIVKCEDISFAKNNPHVLQAPKKKELWYCEIAEHKNTLPSTEQRSENNEIHFVNCSDETKLVNYKNKTVDIKVPPISDGKNISVKEETDVKVSSQTNPKNIITIHIAEKPNNCSNKSSITINEGKIIDLGLNNTTEKILQNNNVNLILSNCLNDHFFTINNKELAPNTELTIILKNESLNTSNLKQFNGTVKNENVKQRILLRCDHTNPDLNGNSSSNHTQLQCESIDLELNNITGIEITTSTPITNKETPVKSISRQEPSTWNCLISEKQQKKKLHFENCSNDGNMNDSKNESVKNNVSPDSDSENKNITITEPKNDININNTEIPSGQLEQNKDNLSEHIITISISENANNCSNNSSINVDKGKIVDFGDYNNKEEIRQNNVELKISNCINVKASIINETRADSKVDITIILKSEALNASELEQFNGTLEEGNEKQRILLQCDHPNFNTTSNTTVLQCESIDLDLYNITGIEISEKSNGNDTKETKKENLNNDVEIDDTTKVNKNSSLSTNQTVEDNNKSTVNNKSKENKEVQKDLSESKENLKKENFNRRKDIPTGTGQNSLAIRSAETEKILLIALLSIAGGAILIVIALRICTKKKEYNLAPTREPPLDEETAF